MAGIELSSRALKYIQSLHRDPYWVVEEAEAEAYLVGHGIQPYQQFLRFQQEFSGYEFTILGSPESGFTATLLSREQVRNQQPPEFQTYGDRLMEICGDHKTAQFFFYLTHLGEFCTVEEDQPNILYHSFHTFVETCALKNELHSWERNPHFYAVKNPELLLETMSEYPLVAECSDAYNVCWQSKDLTAIRGVWLDQPAYYLHVYARKRSIADDCIARLKKMEIIG